MGVEYRRYLIPKPNSFRPTVEATLRLITVLREKRWLLAPDAPALQKLPFACYRDYKFAKTTGFFVRSPGMPPSRADLAVLFEKYADKDLMVIWPVEKLTASGLKYPLVPVPFNDPIEADDCYYEFQMHFGTDYIYHFSEAIEPFSAEPICACGHQLKYDLEIDDDPFYSSRLARECSECGLPFDPTNLVAIGRDGWTGKPFQMPGGATYRFAIMVECGKFFGKNGHKFDPQLKRLVEKTLGIQTHEVPDFH